MESYNKTPNLKDNLSPLIISIYFRIRINNIELIYGKKLSIILLKGVYHGYDALKEQHEKETERTLVNRENHLPGYA